MYKGVNNGKVLLKKTIMFSNRKKLSFYGIKSLYIYCFTVIILYSCPT